MTRRRILAMGVAVALFLANGSALTAWAEGAVIQWDGRIGALRITV